MGVNESFGSQVELRWRTLLEQVQFYQHPSVCGWRAGRAGRGNAHHDVSNESWCLYALLTSSYQSWRQAVNRLRVVNPHEARCSKLRGVFPCLQWVNHPITELGAVSAFSWSRFLLCVFYGILKTSICSWRWLIYSNLSGNHWALSLSAK